MTLSNNTFVGRQRELAQLTVALDEAASGRGRLVMLVGEPGIGKTRLVHELARIAEDRGAQIFWGSCYEQQGAPPYWPWIQPLRGYIRQSDTDGLASQLGSGAPVIAEILPDIHEKLADLKSPTTMAPESARFRLFDAIATLFDNVAADQPPVIVLDDLHWADGPSLQLLEFIVHEIADSRILLIGTYRDVDVTRRHPLSQSLGTLVREQLFSSVELRGLNQKEVGQLAEATSGVHLEQNVLESIHGRTEGNPLFVCEVARLLDREGADDGGIRWDVRIPSGIRDVIGRRLDRLSEECNRILTTASVIGREFDFRLLKALSEESNDDQLLVAIDEALQSRVIEEVQGSTERYQFMHALVQQTLSDELSKSRKVRVARADRSGAGGDARC